MLHRYQPWWKVESFEAFVPSDSPQNLVKILFRFLDPKPDLIHHYLQETHNGNQYTYDLKVIQMIHLNQVKCGSHDFEKHS